MAKVELVSGQTAANMVKNSVKAVAHYFREREDGHYGGPELDL